MKQYTIDSPEKLTMRKYLALPVVKESTKNLSNFLTKLWFKEEMKYEDILHFSSKDILYCSSFLSTNYGIGFYNLIDKNKILNAINNYKPSQLCK